MDVINYKRDTIVNTIAQILYLFVLWLMTIITPRIGSSADAGVFTIALSVSNICTAIATYSINFYVASDIKNKFKDQHYLYFGLTSTFISLIVSIIVSLSFGYYKDSVMFWAVILYYIYKCAENITLIITASMQRAGKLYISGYALIVKAILSLAIFCITLFVSKNIVLAFGLIAAFAFIYLILVDYRLLKKYTNQSFKFDKEIYKVALSLFVLALPLFIYGIAFAAIGSFPRMVLEKFASKEVVGYFGTMAAITSVIQSAVSSLFVPFLPKLAKCYQGNDKKELLKMIAIFFALIIVATGAAFLCACFLDKWLLGILYPADKVALDYAHYFKWIILIAGLQAFTLVAALTLISFRKLIYVGIFSLLGMVLMFATSFTLISIYSIYGVICTFVLGYGTMFIGLFICACTYLLKRNTVRASS